MEVRLYEESIMKVMTLIISGAAIALMTVLGGCSVEDTVKDIVENELKPNVIYVVNGTAGTINVAVTGKNTRNVASQNFEAVSYVLTKSSTYTVSYDGGHSKGFSWGSTYLYAATNCNTNGYISDEVDKNRVHVVNLTGETFTDTIQVIDANGDRYIITDDAPACRATTSNQLDNVVVGNGMQVKIGDGDWETLPDIPEDLVSLANSVKVDVIVYSTTTGTIVPMAGYEDLLRQ